jgi:hypothetical protein
MKANLLLLLFLLTACQKKESVVPVVVPQSEGATASHLEDEVASIIKKVNESRPEHRKSLLISFLNYADRVDGAVSELYGNFAFEYVEDQPKAFFSVLTPADSLLVKKWATVSATEMQILGDSKEGVDSVFVAVAALHSQHQKSFTPEERQLDALYLKQLKQKISE